MPSPSSNTMTSGLPAASSVSMVRVRAGPLARVVVTTPKSVKMAQSARAGIFHGENVAAQRHAGGLEGIDGQAAVAHAR